MTDRIEWDEPQTPKRCGLVVETADTTTKPRYATPADLLAAGYVPAGERQGEPTDYALEWQAAVEHALGVEHDLKNHDVEWAFKTIREIREIGNKQPPQSEPVGYISESSAAFPGKRTFRARRDDYHSTAVYLAPPSKDQHVARLQTQIERQKSHIATLEKTCAGYREKVDGLERENHDLVCQREAARDNMDEADCRVDDLIKARDSALARVKELEDLQSGPNSWRSLYDQAKLDLDAMRWGEMEQRESAWNAEARVKARDADIFVLKDALKTAQDTREGAVKRADLAESRLASYERVVGAAQEWVYSGAGCSQRLRDAVADIDPPCPHCGTVGCEYPDHGGAAKEPVRTCETCAHEESCHTCQGSSLTHWTARAEVKL